jgi:hypothetical protein
LSSPKDLIVYLSTLEITVKNVKEILDCQVVDILHEHKDQTSKELLKKLKTTLIARYFDDDIIERPKIKKL